MNISGTRQALRSQTLGHWLPKDRGIIAQWVAQKAEAASKVPDGKLFKDGAPLDPSLAAFQKLVDESPYLLKLANDMFTEASNKYPEDPVGNCAINSFSQFINVLALVMQSGPEFFDKAKPETAMGLIGFPINALLDWPMGTVSGYEFFLQPTVNDALREVLNSWGKFLSTPDSKACLDGWLSETAQQLIATKGNNGATEYTFQELFVCPDPSDTYLGFGSWDEFFVREFRDAVRPVTAPDDGAPDPQYPDPTLVITNACESAPLQVQTDVRLFDTFYLKGQPYSLGNMLNCGERTAEFVGGTVYQAFLSALSYHRWHAPVSGKVVAVESVPGTYYSENWFEGLAGAQDPQQADPAGPNYSQPYISAVATRSIIYIQATNPKIGLMAIVFIGMAEVSSCEFTVKAGQDITKGQELGMFHFGGSSHCMVFRPGVEIRFVCPPPWDMDQEHNLAVRSELAVVV
ncbi:phosphatidylserine decarboxylase family protein [Diaporthe amygdali]|uniref:phosphatidylserine decarboxylase family protein n=1 Tax=Phomopsis amygdali TaxID=1214568 RepID=UPI0022FEAAAA|nr:phosphatidylserine decarboxylase family protein [Diaporthe amygdali]KAJ0124605.1 phosphatidylserine decarboxylase family protein [Diaporthe amygdali]